MIESCPHSISRRDLSVQGMHFRQRQRLRTLEYNNKKKKKRDGEAWELENASQNQYLSPEGLSVEQTSPCKSQAGGLGRADGRRYFFSRRRGRLYSMSTFVCRRYSRSHCPLGLSRGSHACFAYVFVSPVCENRCLFNLGEIVFAPRLVMYYLLKKVRCRPGLNFAQSKISRRSIHICVGAKSSSVFTSTKRIPQWNFSRRQIFRSF